MHPLKNNVKLSIFCVTYDQFYQFVFYLRSWTPIRILSRISIKSTMKRSRSGIYQIEHGFYYLSERGIIRNLVEKVNQSEKSSELLKYREKETKKGRYTIYNDIFRILTCINRCYFSCTVACRMLTHCE